MENRTASAEMVAEANPPAGFLPIVSSSPFGWENGPIFERKDQSGWARGFRVLEKHTNNGGICHGGMLMTFADILLSRAVLEVLPSSFVTVRLVTDFVGPGVLGQWLEGTAEVSSVTDGIVSVKGKLVSPLGTVFTTSAIFKAVGRQRKTAS
ncbi:MAG: PaaI family thioesterase [Kordiimonadaceae bacterium]|nr:PaaI family thioesterase [Kordiimonadaceae bacterium]